MLRRLRRWWDILASDGSAYGYFPNASKSILVVKERCYREALELFSDTSVIVTCNGARYLGAAIGSADFKENFVLTKVREWADELTRLADFARSQPQAAYYAYASGLRSRWAFLCRVQSISPSQFQPLEDVITTKLIPAMTGRPPPGTVLSEVLAMPCRLGGLGLVSPMTLCAQYESPVAITASLSRRIVDRVSDIGNSLIGIQRENAKRKK